jgi:hypothetical protein
MIYYKLNGKEIEKVGGYQEMLAANLPISSSIMHDEACGASISTVFLSMDHSYCLPWETNKSPVLFETMVFGGKHDGYQERYYTYDEAAEGHQRILEMVDPSIKRDIALGKLGL